MKETRAVSKEKHKSDGSTASYYELPADAQQLQDLISFKNMNGQIAEIFRACYRYGKVAHSEKLRDAKKMKFYAEAEIERLMKYGEEDS
jgi:Flp pilus assembly CpaF family ATPase